MTYTDRHILDTISRLVETLSEEAKGELLNKLNKSAKLNTKTVEERFSSSFGAFDSSQTAEEIIEDIRSSRYFRDKQIEF